VGRWVVFTTIISICATSLLACGRPDSTYRPNIPSGSTTFSTDDIPPPQISNEASKGAPLGLNDDRHMPLPAYQVPQPFLERVKKSEPSWMPEAATGFQVLNQHFGAKDSVMSFSGTLRIDGKQDEPIALRCRFDMSVLPWTCKDMFPTDEKVAQDKRLQATAICMDPPKCRYTGVELFVVIGGKTVSQLFQSEPFRARIAQSGDVEETAPDKDQVLKPEPGPSQPKVQEKPKTDGKAQPKPEDKLTPPKKYQDRVPQEPDASANDDDDDTLSDDELEKTMDNPNIAIEFNSPIRPPNPSAGRYSIPEIEQLRPEIGSTAPSQAINYHFDGSLQHAVQLPMKGRGFACRADDGRNWGTNLMINLLEKTSVSVDKSFPGCSPVVVANISKKYGGPLVSAAGNAHASHQTGLDADIVFPSRKVVDEMWAPCRFVKIHDRKGTHTVCADGSPISKDFDDERFWTFIKTMNCAQGSPVIAIFMDKEIKKHVCAYVRRSGENMNDACVVQTLQSLKHETGHYNHFHVRLHCPGNRECREKTVTLATGTGC
jgi:murein endopeptidase